MKLLVISSVATPLMDKLNRALGSICDSTFIFHSAADLRPDWWSEHDFCKSSIICDNPLQLMSGFYFSTEPLRRCREINPHVIILGGCLSPSCWFVYRWAVKNKVPVILFSEPLGRGNSLLSKWGFFYSKFFKLIFNKAYKNIDYVLGVGELTENYFSHIIDTNKKFIRTQYPVDMEQHLNHRLRSTSRSLRLLFPHRLVEEYNPLTAVEWFAEINKSFPKTTLKMNNFGDMKKQVVKRINELGIEKKVKFVDKISRWSDLPEVYKNSDIVISPKQGQFKSIDSPWGVSDWSIAEMEACASGMGFITSKCSLGLNATMLLSQAGFIIDKPSNISSVLRAVEAYSSHQGLLERDGSLLRKEVKQFSIPNTARNLHNFLIKTYGVKSDEF